jgi:preprotein translocase subunit YajC
MLYAVLLFAEDAAKDAPPIWASPIVPLGLMLVALFVLVILPARRRERAQREQVMNNLKKNDEVVTSSGIIGIIANIKDHEVTLKVDESSNVRLRVLKSSIMQIMPKEGVKDGAAATSMEVKAGSPPK